MTQTHRKIYHVLGLEESISSKWYYPRQSTYSTQFLSYYQKYFFTELEQKTLNTYGKIKTPKKPKQSWEGKTELKRSGSLTSNCITKLLPSKQYGTGTKKQTHTSMEQNSKPRNKPTHLWSINVWQRRQEYIMEKWEFLQ